MNTAKKLAVLSALALIALGTSALQAQGAGRDGKLTVALPEVARAPRAGHDDPCGRLDPAGRFLVAGGRQGFSPAEYKMQRSSPVPAWTDPILMASVGIQF